MAALYCLSCGKSIPNESQFCMYCGKTIPRQSSLKTERLSPTLSRHLPVSIGTIFLGFEGTMKSLGGLNRIKRGFQIWFQIIDDKGSLTTYNGRVRMYYMIRQHYGLINSILEQDTIYRDVKATDFMLNERSENIFYLYHHPEIKVCSDYNGFAECELKIWFQPEGSQEKLFKVWNGSISVITNL